MMGVEFFKSFSSFPFFLSHVSALHLHHSKTLHEEPGKRLSQNLGLSRPHNGEKHFSLSIIQFCCYGRWPEIAIEHAYVHTLHTHTHTHTREARTLSAGWCLYMPTNANLLPEKSTQTQGAKHRSNSAAVLKKTSSTALGSQTKKQASIIKSFIHDSWSCQHQEINPAFSLPSLGVVIFFAYFFPFSPGSHFQALVGAVLYDTFSRESTSHLHFKTESYSSLPLGHCVGAVDRIRVFQSLSSFLYLLTQSIGLPKGVRK